MSTQSKSPARPKLRPRIMWADYDPDATLPMAYYTSRKEQRGNRPDLKPIKGVFVPLSDMDAIRERVKRALDTENGTGAGYDHAAHLALHAIGLAPKWSAKVARGLLPRAKKKPEPPPPLIKALAEMERARTPKKGRAK